jgi:hypothetical protein
MLGMGSLDRIADSQLQSIPGDPEGGGKAKVERAWVHRGLVEPSQTTSQDSDPADGIRLE